MPSCDCFDPPGCPSCRSGSRTLSELLDRGQLLVLDLGTGTVGAAAYVRMDARNDGVHARLRFLVASPTLAGTGAEDRMAAAVVLICESTGCIDIDVMTEHTSPARSTGATPDHQPD